MANHDEQMFGMHRRALSSGEGDFLPAVRPDYTGTTPEEEEYEVPSGAPEDATATGSSSTGQNPEETDAEYEGRLRRECFRLGGTRAQVDSCTTVEELEDLRDYLEREFIRNAKSKATRRRAEAAKAAAEALKTAQEGSKLQREAELFPYEKIKRRRELEKDLELYPLELAAKRRAERKAKVGEIAGYAGRIAKVFAPRGVKVLPSAPSKVYDFSLRNSPAGRALSPGMTSGGALHAQAGMSMAGKAHAQLGKIAAGKAHAQVSTLGRMHAQTAPKKDIDLSLLRKGGDLSNIGSLRLLGGGFGVDTRRWPGPARLVHEVLQEERSVPVGDLPEKTGLSRSEVTNALSFLKAIADVEVSGVGKNRVAELVG